MHVKLGDFTTPERLQFLVNLLTDNGKKNHRFENFTLLNTSKWVLAGTSLKNCLRFYGFPEENPLYVFIAEVSDIKCLHLHVRTPTNGHQSELLEQGLKAVVEVLRPTLEQHGGMLLEADITVRDAFLKLQSEGAQFETLLTGHCYPFYMNEQQKRQIMEKEYSVPEGYSISTVNVPDEYEFIHSMWPFGDCVPAAATLDRLEHLPSVCIRDSNGQIVAWELMHSLGTMAHLYTLEKHRGKGLGVLAENLLSQILVRQGLHVYKYVFNTNVDVIRRTRKHPMWSEGKTHGDDEGRRWITDDGEGEGNGGNVSNGEGIEGMWSFSSFKYTGK